jgi:hypothetical protein
LRVSDCDLDGHQDLLVLSPISQQGGDKRGHVAVVLNFMEKVTAENVYYLVDAEVVLTGKENY